MENHAGTSWPNVLVRGVYPLLPTMSRHHLSVCGDDQQVPFVEWLRIFRMHPKIHAKAYLLPLLQPCLQKAGAR